jgi:hypothetical protein
MNTRLAFTLSFIAGLAVLGLTALGLSGPTVPVCGNLPTNYAPIIAFELVRSVQDLHAIFGDSAGACRTAIAARLDYINEVDSYAFIPAYGAFLVFFFLGMRARNAGLAGLAIVLTLAACFADYAENYCLFHLSAHPDSTDWIAPLMLATESKWIGLGVVGMLGGLLLWRDGSRIDWLVATLCAIGLAATLTTLVAPHHIGPYLSNALALGWIVFLVVDIRETVRPMLSSALA